MAPERDWRNGRICDEVRLGDRVWMKCCGSEGCLLTVVKYRDGAIEKCGSDCKYIIRCRNITVGV